LAKRAARTRGRSVKAKSRAKVKKAARPRAKRRAKVPQEGPIAEAVHAVVDTIEEAAALRRRLAGRDTFED
jgi:hypothetical protein